MDNDFNKWVSMWDAAVDGMEKEVPAKKAAVPNSSFFGMDTPDDVAQDYINKQDLTNWQDVLDRTDQLRAPTIPGELLQESTKKTTKKQKPTTKKKKDPAEDPAEVDDDEEGLAALLSKHLGDKKQFISPNPIHFASIGTDQKVRVTPNWTSGETLAALAKLKSMMYDLECELLTKEGLGVDIGNLENRLTSMQKQVHKMSEMLTPDAGTDVS